MQSYSFIVFFIVVGIVINVQAEDNEKPSEEHLKAFREMMKCSHENCKSESQAFHKYMKESPILACMEKCNPDKKNVDQMNEKENQAFHECMKTSECREKKSEWEKKQQTPEFKALRECVDSKCPEEVKKLQASRQKGKN